MKIDKSRLFRIAYAIYRKALKIAKQKGLSLTNLYYRWFQISIIKAKMGKNNQICRQLLAYFKIFDYFCIAKRNRKSGRLLCAP